MNRPTILLWSLALVALTSGARADDLHVLGASADGARVALFAVTADVPRGFHEQALQVRSAPDGAIVDSTPLLPSAVRSRWARSGDFELYRLDVERARAAAIARVRSELGFAPLVSVLSSRAASAPVGPVSPDPRQPSDPPAVATLRLHDQPVDALVRNEGDRAAVVLRHGDREVALDARPLDVVDVPDRKVTIVYRWFGVREAWTDPAGRTLLLVVDTYVPIQRSFPARSVLVMAPLAPLLEGLGVAPGVADGAGGPLATAR